MVAELLSELKTGRFWVTPERAVPGELQIAGPESELVLRDEREIPVSATERFSLRGHLYDNSRVTLVDCLQLGQISHQTRDPAGATFSTRIFPHYIVKGRTDYPLDQANIRTIAFTFEDASALFCDFDAFGSVTQDAGALMQMIGESYRQRFGRSLPIGPHPSIAYFAGQSVILDVDTVIGRITAEHRPTWPGGGPAGVRLDNQIWVALSPLEPVTLETAVTYLLSMLRFVALAVGRRQTVRNFAIETSENGKGHHYEVSWSHHPQRRSSQESRDPHPFDLPLDPIRRSAEFTTALKSWLQREVDWRAARIRVDDGCADQNNYSINRLVGAANAFDLLPESAVPTTVVLSSDVQAAREQCRALFRRLPPSDERETLLRAVGRLGQATLKQKVRHRAAMITHATQGEYFAKLAEVCNFAVEARNHYVHGSAVECDVERQCPFLTDTLEFVFLASDLLEAGWDIRPRLKSGTSMTHPFGSYWGSYAERLRRLHSDTTRAGPLDNQT